MVSKVFTGFRIAGCGGLGSPSGLPVAHFEFLAHDGWKSGFVVLKA